MRWFLTPLRRYADFTGRSRRADYWMFVLFVSLGAIILAFVDEGLGLTHTPPGIARGLPFVAESGVLSSVYGLALAVPMLAIGARRLHDIGTSGWLQLIWVVPFLGTVVMFVLHVVDGTRGPNHYGPDPKETAGAEHE